MKTSRSVRRWSLKAGLAVFAAGVTWMPAHDASMQCWAADEPSTNTQSGEPGLAVERGGVPYDPEEEAARWRAADEAISDRRERIEEELAELRWSDLPDDHWAREWAGAYYVGDGLGMNVYVFVAPEAGITYIWRGCTGLYDGGHGDIVEVIDLDGDEKPDGLRIDWELRLESVYNYTCDEFYFVRWAGPDGAGGRRYLVPASWMIQVVNDLNAGGLARQGLHTAARWYDHTSGRGPRWSGYRGPVVGFPQMPEKWSRLLCTEPVDVIVMQVGAVTTGGVPELFDTTSARISLNKGSADGLYIGLEVRVELPHGFRATITIDELQEHIAGAECRVFSDVGECAPMPSVGDTFRMIHGVGEGDAADDQ